MSFVDIDDFAVVEWEVSARASHEALIEMMKLIGMPFEPAKHIATASTFVFLGVETAFGAGPCAYVRMSVRPDRVKRLAEDLGKLLEGTRLPSAVAASMCGRLQFTLSWGFCRFGKGVMQPLTARRSGVMGPAGKRKRGSTTAEEQPMTRAWASSQSVVNTS